MAGMVELGPPCAERTSWKFSCRLLGLSRSLMKDLSSTTCRSRSANCTKGWEEVGAGCRGRRSTHAVWSAWDSCCCHSWCGAHTEERLLVPAGTSVGKQRTCSSQSCNARSYPLILHTNPSTSPWSTATCFSDILVTQETHTRPVEQLQGPQVNFKAASGTVGRQGESSRH